MNDDNWIALLKQFTEEWHSRSNNSWKSINQNTILSSALTSLYIYSNIYLYTSDSFLMVSLNERLFVRISLFIIPLVMFIINIKYSMNFKHQCKDMYENATVVFKLQEKLGLLNERDTKDKFPDDRWYVPSEWIYSTDNSELFVDNMMKKTGGFYKRMNWLFILFIVISILLAGFNYVLLLLILDC